MYRSGFLLIAIGASLVMLSCGIFRGFLGPLSQRLQGFSGRRKAGTRSETAGGHQEVSFGAADTPADQQIDSGLAASGRRLSSAQDAGKCHPFGGRHGRRASTTEPLEDDLPEAEKEKPAPPAFSSGPIVTVKPPSAPKRTRERTRPLHPSRRQASRRREVACVAERELRDLRRQLAQARAENENFQ